MAWLKYDPKYPPKMGQPARSKDFAEFIICQGFGHGLCEGDTRKVDEQWEIWWEIATQVPPVGSFIQLAGWTTNQDWAGAVGRVVSHTKPKCASIEWISLPKSKLPPDEFYFPHENVIIISTPPVPQDVENMNKVKVGQVWTHDSGCVAQITSILDGNVSAKILQKGISIWYDGQVVKEFAILNPDDTPSNRTSPRSTALVDPWKITKEAPKTYEDRGTVKVGEIYRQDGCIIKITKEWDNISSFEAETIEQGTLEYPKGTKRKYTTFCCGRVNLVWELIVEAPEQKKEKPLFKKGDRVCWTKAPYVIGGEKKWIGTVVEDYDGQRFLNIRYDHFKYICSTDWHNHSIDVIESNTMIPKIALGQTWRRKDDGYTVRVAKITDTIVDMEIVAPASTNLRVGDIRKNFGQVQANGEVDWVGWDLIEETQGKNMEAKTGQIWIDKKRGWKIQVIAVHGTNTVSARQIGDSNGYTDGYVHASFANPANNDYALVQDVPRPGDPVRHADNNLQNILGNGKIVNIDSSGIATVRFEKYKYDGMGAHHSYLLRELICLEKEGKNMNKDSETKETFGQMVKADFKDAAWRSASTQMSNAVQAAILTMLKDKGMAEDRLSVAKEILASEMGGVLIRAGLGFGLPHIPMVGEDPRAQRLAKEFRVSAMDRGMEEVMGVAMTYLMPAFTSAMNALPPLETAVPNVLKSKPKHRVADASDIPSEEEETETATSEPKVAGA